MEPVSFWAYLIPLTLLTLSPGVDTLLVIRNTHRGGPLEGMVSSLGICSGLFVHAAFSALGISVLLQSAWAFTALKLAGAAYLIWLGLCSLRSAVRAAPLALASGEAPPRRARLRRALLEGVLSNVLNPKTAVFYLAFLPQFIDPARPTLPQSFYLAAVHFALSLAWLCLLALLLGRLRQWLQQPRVQQVLEATTGTVLLLLGGKLALTRL